MRQYAMPVTLFVGVMLGLILATAIGQVANYSQALLTLAIVSLIVVAAIILAVFKIKRDTNECEKQRHQLHKAFEPRIREIETTVDHSIIEYLRSRWLDQVISFEGKAILNASQYTLLHGIAVIGSAIIPALAGLNFADNNGMRIYIQSITVGLSLVIAIALALEHASHSNDRWRFYRNAAEALKAEGWGYLTLCGDYQKNTHQAKFSDFAEKTEKIIQSAGADYIASVVMGNTKQ